MTGCANVRRYISAKALLQLLVLHHDGTLLNAAIPQLHVHISTLLRWPVTTPPITIRTMFYATTVAYTSPRSTTTPYYSPHSYGGTKLPTKQRVAIFSTDMAACSFIRTMWRSCRLGYQGGMYIRPHALRCAAPLVPRQALPSTQAQQGSQGQAARAADVSTTAK